MNLYRKYHHKPVRPFYPFTYWEENITGYRDNWKHYEARLNQDPSCKLYLPFYKHSVNETKIYDLSGNGKNATITEAVPTTLASPALGWYCDGSNDLFTLSNVFTTNQTALTILSWVYCHAFDQPVGVAAYNSIYFATGGNEGYTLRMEHITSNTSQWAILIRNGATSVQLNTTAVANATFNSSYLNKWLCVCATFQASTRMKLWINGTAAVADKTAGVLAVMDAYTGATDKVGSNLAYYANFTYSEIAIFNKAFTDTELRNYHEITRRKYS